MKYLVQTFTYLKKSFWLPIVAMLIPAGLACFLSTPYWEVSFVAAFDYDPYLNASQTFTVLFGDSWQFVWPVVLIALFQIMGAAMVMSAVDMHFRTGRLSLRSPFRHINNTVFPIAIGVAVMSVFSILWRFLLFGLVMLVQVICGAIGFPAGAALAVISVITVGMFFLHVLIITPVLFWAPIMFIYGYKFRDAAAMSYKMLSGKNFFWGLFLPMLICAGIQLLVGFLQAPAAVAITVGFLVFIFTNGYATVYTMIAFYSISELERRDVEPYRSIPLPVVQKKQDHAKKQAPQQQGAPQNDGANPALQSESQSESLGAAQSDSEREGGEDVV